MKFYNVATCALTLTTSANIYAADLSPKVVVPTDTCDNVLNQYHNSQCDQYCLDSIKQQYPYCFSNTSEAGSANSTTVTSFNQVQTISNVISNRFLRSNVPFGNKTSSKFSNSGTGMSSGSEFTKWNMWGSLTRNETDQNFNLRGFESTMSTGVLGGDYTLAPNMVLGISASLNRGDGSIDYVENSSIVSTNSDNDSFAIAPCF